MTTHGLQRGRLKCQGFYPHLVSVKGHQIVSDSKLYELEPVTLHHSQLPSIIMASTTRLGVLVGRASSCPYYVCLQCRLNASAASRKSSLSFLSPPSARRHASNSPFSERLRKKIWGSETPPGAEDPYAVPGTPEQRRREKEDAREQEKGLAKTGSPAVPAVPAENGESQKSKLEEEDGEDNDAITWEGMTTVGGRDYGMDRWDEEHPFQGFVNDSSWTDCC